MAEKNNRWKLIALLGLILFLLACRLVQNFPGLPEPTTTQTPKASETTPAATPTPESPVEDWGLTATAFVYPGPGDYPILATVNPEPATSPTPDASPEILVLTPDLTATALVYPDPDSISPPFPPQPGLQDTPNSESPTGDLYPFPDPGFTPEGIASPTLTLLPTFGAIPFDLVTATETPGGNQFETLTATFEQSQVVTLTPTATEFIFLTPTPSPTPAPTATATPVPLPPWLAAQLYATDPESVSLSAGRVQLVEFFAYWSGICLAMAPTLHNLEVEFGSQVNFIYLDIDDPAVGSLKKMLGFRLEPHFFLLDGGGKILRQWTGYVSYQELADALNVALR